MMALPNLIIVTGLPAVGKSHFSRLFSRETGYPILEKDAYKVVLFDDVGFKSREEKVKLGIAAMDLMYSEAARLLDLGISVILDNNFESSSRPGLEKLTAEHPCNPVTVLFTGDPAIVYARFVMRDMDPKRHRGHVLNTSYPETGTPEKYVPIGPDAFEKKFRERGVFDFTFGEKVITVDATDPAAVDEEALVSELKGYLA